MDAAELRARQKPLKDRYKEDPGSAMVTSRAEGRLADDDIACAVEGWRGQVVAGLHPSTGGDGSQACSADILLRALVACAGVTLKSVATAMGVNLRDARVVAEGDWDARGTLGIDKQAPVGLSDVRLTFTLDTDADDATVAKLVQLTERFCVIYQTLKNPPRVATETQATRAAG
jgi:uncharacterized OsmC-like protein